MTIKTANIHFGIAPIGWRNDDIPEIGKENTYKQILSDAVLAGYEGTEIGGCYPNNPEELNKEVNLRKTRIIGKWFSGFIIQEGIEKTKEDFSAHCAFLKAVHADIAVYSEQTYSIQGTKECIYTKKPFFNDEEWKELTYGLNILGEIANDHGLKLAYHHHLGTGIQTKKEVDRLMNATDPSKVHLLYDTGHIYASDNETMPLLRDHFSRIAHVHFKDVRKEKLSACKMKKKSFLDSFLDGMFTVPGDGVIAYKEIYNYLIDHGYTGWVVVEAEQDPEIANPLEYALKGKNYLDALRLARYI